MSLLRATIGLKTTPESYMTFRERFDFAILVTTFSVLLAASVVAYFYLSAFSSRVFPVSTLSPS